MSKWDAYKSEKWAAYSRPNVPAFSAPGIEEEIARRETPTRFEQFADKAIGKDKREVLDKFLGLLSPTMGAGPAPSRSLGEAADMAIDIPMGILQAGKQAVSSPDQIPNMLINILKGAGTSLATTAKHPVRSFKGRPIQAAGDVYALSQGAKAVVSGAKAIKPVLKINPIQKETIYTIGKRAQTGVNQLRKEYGAAVGAEKAIARQIKGQIDMTKVVSETEKAIAEAGVQTFDPSDLRAIRLVEKNLQKMNGRPNAAILMETKDMINNRFLTFGKPGQVVPTKMTGYGEKILRNMRDQIDAQLRFHDARPELGGTGGKWAKANEEFKRVADLHERASRLIGQDLNLENKMTKVGMEMVDGNPAYKELFQSIDDLLPADSKFASQLEDAVLGLRATKAMQKIPVLGGAIRTGTAIKALGGLGLRKGARLASQIGTGIESIPAPWELRP